jgi:hypothetical protein
VKIELATCEVMDIVGTISDRDVRKAELLVARHVRFLNEEWTKIHGKSGTDRKRS